jgi:hypothetical protein
MDLDAVQAELWQIRAAIVADACHGDVLSHESRILSPLVESGGGLPLRATEPFEAQAPAQNRAPLDHEWRDVLTSGCVAGVWTHTFPTPPEKGLGCPRRG